MDGPDVTLAFRLNGRATELTTPTNTVLVDLLRDRLGLTGTKVGCSRGVCGSCTVLMNGRPKAACSTFAFEVNGADVTTIEGLERNGSPDPIQRAFAERSAFQCGYCTAGMIMLARALLAAHPTPSRLQIMEWMNSNVCRCTGYNLIIEAVESASRAMQDGVA